MKHPWNFLKESFDRDIVAKASVLGVPIQQIMVLRLIAQSYNTKEIAEVMKLSEKTVEYHRIQLIKRFGIPNHASAAQALLTRIAVKFGLVSPDYTRNT